MERGFWKKNVFFLILDSLVEPDFLNEIQDVAAQVNILM